jgi:hypothetical protein
MFHPRFVAFGIRLFLTRDVPAVLVTVAADVIEIEVSRRNRFRVNRLSMYSPRACSFSMRDLQLRQDTHRDLDGGLSRREAQFPQRLHVHEGAPANQDGPTVRAADRVMGRIVTSEFGQQGRRNPHH